MKAIQILPVLIVFILFFSCGEHADKKELSEQEKRAIRSYEFDGRDTLNIIDRQGFRQGRWRVQKFLACTQTVQTQYAGEKDIQTKIIKTVDAIKVEEGNYVDNKKEGLWKTYRTNGAVKDSMVYKNGEVVK